MSALDSDPKNILRTVRFDAGEGLLRVEFDRAWDARTTNHHRYRVDPANQWHTVDYRLESSDGSVTATQYSYGEAVEGLSFPTASKCVTDWKGEQTPPNMEITTRLVSLKLTDKTPADFRMSAFGLPEPMGMPAVERGVRWYIWFIAAGFVCLVFGALLLRWKRRSGNPQPTAAA